MLAPADFDRLAREVAGVPGVAKAAASLMTPVVGGGIIEIVRLPSVPPSFEPMNNGKLGDHST